jgi:hypothetical protein
VEEADHNPYAHMDLYASATAVHCLQAWSVGALIAFVLVFNCIPAVLELLTFLFVARVSYFSY